MSYSFSFYCKCGAGWTGTVPTVNMLQKMEEIWKVTHSDFDRVPCDAKTARSNRMKVKRQIERGGIT